MANADVDINERETFNVTETTEVINVWSIVWQNTNDPTHSGFLKIIEVKNEQQ